MTQPFSSTYLYTLTHVDPRSQIPPHLFDLARYSALSISILESWRASEPSQAVRDNIVRILDRVNVIFQSRYGKRYRFVIDIFGSVSWGGETGGEADVDMALKVSYRLPLSASLRSVFDKSFARTLIDRLDVCSAQEPVGSLSLVFCSF